MAGRPKIFDTKAVIDRATPLFWSGGYEATSTESLLEAMGIGKGSFYLAFPGGKKELFEKSLEQFSEEATGTFKKKLAASKDPIEDIRDFFRSMAVSNKEVQQRGCYIGNTLAETAGQDVQLSALAAKLLKRLEHLFYDTLENARQQGTLKTKESPAVLARYLITMWNGLNITRRMYADPAALRPLIDLQLKVLH